MPRASTIQGDFTAGELSPLMFGRVDSDKYKKGLALGLNWIGLIQGGLTRRPGSIFCGEVKFSSKATRLEAFKFSVFQNYMIEFGDLYVRFYKDGELITGTPTAISAATNASPGVFSSLSDLSVVPQLTNGARVVVTGIVGMPTVNNREYIVESLTMHTLELKDAQTGVLLDTTLLGTYVSGGTFAVVYEVATPYTDSDVFILKYTQSLDVLYIVHPNYPPAKLIRTADTNWAYSVITFLDGPYEDVNNTATTLTPSATTGAATLTASATAGINNGNGFATTDVGRLIRLFASDSNWYWVKITAFTSTTIVTVNIAPVGPSQVLPDTTAVTTWQLGLYSATEGYPSCAGFHEQRLVLGGAGGAPQELDGSVTDDFENFSPTAIDGTISASNAYSFDLDSDDVNIMRWISTDEKGLLAGTAGGEWFIRPSSTDSGIAPGNVNAKESTTWGAPPNVDVIKIGRSHLHVNLTGRKLRELTYDFYVDGFDSEDMTLISEHITAKGILQITFQEAPQTIVWAVRQDGVLLSMSYDRDGQNVKAGWYRHILGGVSDAAGSPSIVESVACIPSEDQSFDELYVVVNRFINGRTARFIERLTKIFEDIDEQIDAVMVDSATTFDNPVAVISITQANPPLVTANGHGFSNGDNVKFTDVIGMPQVLGPTFVVASETTNTFTLLGIDGTSFAPYVSSGNVRKLETELSGLNYLEGQTVQILGDGAVLNEETVVKGAISLSYPSAVVQIGLGYDSDGQLMRSDAGAADGTAMGKTRRVNRIGFLLHRSLGLMFGADFNSLNEITFRTSNDLGGRAVPLFSGIMSETIDFDYDFENQLCFRISDPLPCTILAIMPQMETQDRG